MAQILVIDDDDDLRLAIKIMLESDGHVVDEAANGKDGIQQFINQPADLVITDILMPGQDGMETLLAMRTDHPDLPIIVMSGDAAEHLDLAQKFGAAAVLSKPFRRVELLETVAKTLAQ